jgi:hypothetical protein
VYPPCDADEDLVLFCERTEAGGSSAVWEARLRATVIRAQMSIQASTRQRYAAVLLRYAAFAAQFGGTPLRASDAVTAMFLEEVIQHAETHGLGIGVVKEARAAIGWWRECHNLPSVACSPMVSRVFAAASTQLATFTPLDRREATLDDMRALVDHYLFPATGTVDLRDRMHVTGFVLAFAGFLRLGDLVHVLVHAQFLQLRPGSLVIVLPRSKTDTAHRGARVHIPANVGPDGGRYCPVGLTAALLEHGGYVREASDADCGPLMRAVSRVRVGDAYAHVLCELTRDLHDEPIPSLKPTTLSTRLKAMLRAAGRDATHISGHSLRIGAATAAVAGGASMLEVRQRGRWASAPCAEGYVRGPLPEVAVPRRMEH